MDAIPRDLQWQRRYEEDDTPWDKGRPAPALAAFLHQKPITGRVLVPGCGRGHEVRLLGAQPGVSAVGLDLSAAAVEQAKALLFPPAALGGISFIKGDFFRLPSALKNSFDWIVEHTCFCAIDPRERSEYVGAAAEALRSGGKIFAIFYLDPDVESGPPFAVTREDLDRLFDPDFTLLDEWVPQETFAGREGRELVRIMQKRVGDPSPSSSGRARGKTSPPRSSRSVAGADWVSRAPGWRAAALPWGLPCRARSWPRP